MNADSPEAKARSDLFESIAKRKGFVLLNGKYGGDFQSDQLAIHVENGLAMLLLGLKVTLPNGGLQLDQSSMGGYQQFSRGWILAVVKFLSADQETKDHAEAIRKAFEERKLALFLLVLTKPSGEVKFLRITLPE